MKRDYETPVSEVVEFDSSDVISTSTCQDVWVNIGVLSCTDDNAHWEHLN